MPSFFSKLRGKKKKAKPGEKKYTDYESVDVGEKQYTNQRAAPELVVADAPNAPRFGGKGLQGNATYQLQDQDSQPKTEQHEVRKTEGKAALRPFGEAPNTQIEYEEASSPQTDSKGQPAARAAIDGVTDATKPGQDVKAGHEKGGPQLGSGNAPLDDTQPDPVVPPIPERDGVAVNVLVVLKIALGAYLAFLALFTAWLRPSFFAMFWSILLGLGAGLAYSWLFYATRYKKRLLNDGYNIQPGRKGMMELLGQVPSWITFQEKERVTWANLMMQQMWQYYDRAIGQAIKESVEPIMDQYKPPGLVKRIFFKRITFGDLPITIDDVWVENEGEKHILLEMSFRLTGNSNIEIAVEIAGGATRLVPKVTDLHVSGVARVILSPLLPEIPGFGAMVFSLKRPPLIHFNLSFGSALGGGASAGLVKLWLDPFLRETLTSLLVWPNRIVFPILPESPANNLEDLSVKNVGLLRINIVEAQDLDKEDFIGKSDPLVEVWTQQGHIETTHHKRKTLNPSFNATFHLLVQEPKTQAVRLQVYDWDGVHFKEVFSTINVFKGLRESFGAKSFMARTAVDIRPIYDEAGTEVDKWYDLGKNDWSHEEGTGKGHGKIRLKTTYWPFTTIYSKPRKASKGALLVTLKEAKNLPAADSNGLSDPYAVLKLGKETRQSMIQYDTLNPLWSEKFDFVKISIDEVLTIEVWDDDPIDPDDFLGLVEIKIAEEVVPAKDSTIEKIFFLKEVPKDTKTKEEKKSTITVKIQWVPFDFEENA